MTLPTLSFYKMHGLGNDFMVINALKQSFNWHKFTVSKLANRQCGVGFDQLLIIESCKEADYFMRILNADGSEAEQCGNGLRCVARLIYEEKWHTSPQFTIATKAGVFSVNIHSFDAIEVTMGKPIVKDLALALSLKDSIQNASVISLGNPHTILILPYYSSNLVETMGQEIATHSYFLDGTNVGFMQIYNAHHIKLRTYERGSGITLACGSNATAAVAVGILKNLLISPVNVDLPLGTVKISWENPNTSLTLTGPATRVFNGEVFLEDYF